jgi:hypothetical protein
MLRKILLFVFINIALMPQAQEKFTINEYGTYVVYSGMIKKVPTALDLRFHLFYENYAMFFVQGKIGKMVLFNIDSGAASEILDEPYGNGPKILETNPFFVIFYCDHIFKLDPITLKTIEKEYVGPLYIYPDKEYAEYEPVIRERISEKAFRYTGENNYIDVTYGKQINLSRDRGSYGYDCWTVGRLNRYVLEVYPCDYSQ